MLKPDPSPIKQNTISEGWLQPHKYLNYQNFSLPRQNTEAMMCLQWQQEPSLASDKNTWGPRRKSTTRKPAQKVQHELLFFSAAETTKTQNATNQFQAMGKSWKLSMRAFSHEAFLIWCLWNNYPSASELITYISLTLTTSKKYIMQWTKTCSKPQLLQNVNIRCLQAVRTHSWLVKAKGKKILIHDYPLNFR